MNLDKDIINDVGQEEKNWKPIQGYEGLYEICEEEVRKVSNKKILSKWLNSNGYPMCRLVDKNGKMRYHYYHRLIATHYIPNPQNKRCVDHINGNKTDNSLTNLRWATSGENVANSGIRKSNTSKYRGVNYCKKHKKWRAVFRGKFLGYYDDPKEGAIKYEETASAYYGEFYKVINYPELNQIEDSEEEMTEPGKEEILLDICSEDTTSFNN